MIVHGWSTTTKLMIQTCPLPANAPPNSPKFRGTESWDLIFLTFKCPTGWPNNITTAHSQKKLNLSYVYPGYAHLDYWPRVSKSGKQEIKKFKKLIGFYIKRCTKISRTMTNTREWLELHVPHTVIYFSFQSNLKFFDSQGFPPMKYPSILKILSQAMVPMTWKCTSLLARVQIQ